jgi:outer membrane protein assembly factor BamE (lipoprotein component of BamABCDE complex)
MKAMNILQAVAIVAVLTLVSCASAGKQFDTTHVNDIKKGAQSKDQIRAWFGEPYRVQTISGSPFGCLERWTYTHAFSSWGGTKTQTETLVVDFNESGNVCDNSYLEQ